ncbi:MAG: hypothetical protein ABJC39_03420 [Chloroflexota bacterium]
MPDPTAILWLIAGFAFVLVAGANLGAGSHTGLSGLFSADTGRDWPVGVQEADAPRYTVSHLDALRATTADPGPEIVELHSRRATKPRQ